MQQVSIACMYDTVTFPKFADGPAPKSADGFRVKPGMTDEGAALGDTTFDIYLNDRAYWRNVPAAVWRYKLGGYQVLKKWLSYRERTILGRSLRLEEVEHFTHTARRIAAVLRVTSENSS